MADRSPSVLALSGGVGGAKLALGLADTLEPGLLHILANTGDDFRHLGLHISPDIDTLLYTLSSRSNADQGWGLSGETWHAMTALEELNGQTWFRLGDKDLATHLWRTGQLDSGASLSQLTRDLAAQLGIASHIYPMSDEAVHTTVHCGSRSLPFQHYFVREQCTPEVSGFSFEGIEKASPSPAVMQLLKEGQLGCVVVCPSNPFVSIDPILQVPGMWQSIQDSSAPVVLVSPIVAGSAIKGPAAKMMAELGMPVSALEVARHYCERYPGLLKHFVIDQSDAKLAPGIEQLGVAVAVMPTIMKTREDKQALARAVLGLVY